MKYLLEIGRTICAVCCLAAGIGSVAAHHATTMFDFTKLVTVTGTVVEFRWVNPHSSLLIKGTEQQGGPEALWLLEMSSPGNLARVGGWTRTTVKPGDRVQAELAPLRDMSERGGILRKLTLLDTGQVFITDIREQERPGLE